MVAFPYFRHAGQSRTKVVWPESMFIATAPPLEESNDHVGLMLCVLLLGGLNGGIEIVVIEFGIEDGVAVVFEVSGFDAAWDGMEAVEEEEIHGSSAASHM